MDSAMNEEGRLERRLMPWTTAVGVIFWAVALALGIAGLCLVFLTYFKDKPLYYTAGMILLACAAATFMIGIIVTFIVGFNEREKRRIKLERARAEIYAALKEADRICGNGYLSEAAVTADNGSGLNGEDRDPSEGGDER